jgi:hypothetical protein
MCVKAIYLEQQIKVGIFEVSNPFNFEVQTRYLEVGALEYIKGHFKDSNVEITIVNEKGRTKFRAEFEEHLRTAGAKAGGNLHA